MGNHPSKAAADNQISSTLVCDPQRTHLCKSSIPETPKDDRVVTFWECTTCGRRYVHSAATNFFIIPPPTTECIMIRTDETWTHDNGGVVNLSIANGATCDYVRVKRVIGERDLSEQITEPDDAAYAVEIPVVNELSAWACDRGSMKVEGEHGRVSRQNGAVDAACEEEDPEDSEFWKAQCEDIDCIYEGEHCRYQCAMAELDEEHKPSAPAPKRGLRFRRSAT